LAKSGNLQPFLISFTLGSSFGIEDATVLADALLNNPPPANAQGNFRVALEEYARLRVPRSKKVAYLASWQGTISTGERWWWRWIRDVSSRLPAGDPKTYVAPRLWGLLVL